MPTLDRPSSGGKFWIPAFAGMTEEGARDSFTRPKAGIQNFPLGAAPLCSARYSPLLRHSREGGNLDPIGAESLCMIEIPAFAGMTEKGGNVSGILSHAPSRE